MKLVYDPTKVIPVLSASSSTAGTSPNDVLKGTGYGYWQSNSEANPWIQIDLGAIYRTYQLNITLDTVNAPTTLNILCSDNTSETEWGQYSGAYDLVQSVTPTAGTTNSYQLSKARPGRYWKFQMVGTGIMRIKQIAIYGSSNLPDTSARFKIGGTYFTPDSHDLMDIRVREGPISSHISQLEFTINNKNEKYVDTNYPLGSRVLVWIDGVQKLYGVLTLFEPIYDSQSGFVIRGQANDNGDFLINQEIRQSWAATQISDQTKSADILTQGQYSILASVLSSSGNRLFPGTPTGYSNISSTTTGPNSFPSYRSVNKNAWNVLKDLSDKAMDGVWTLQNQGFTGSLVQNSLQVLPNAITDGNWIGYSTNLQLTTTLDPSPATINLAAASGVASLNNGAPRYASAITVSYDGSIANESSLVYGEIFQPVLLPVGNLLSGSPTTCSTGTSFTCTIKVVNTVNAGSGDTVNDQVMDLILETVNPSGTVRRLHSLINNSAPNILTTTDTTLDKYANDNDTHMTICSNGNIAVDLRGLYLNKFQDGSNDIITSFRFRGLPFAGNANSTIGNFQISNLSVALGTTVKSPPVQYDFYVTSTTSSGVLVPDLAWFARPRLGVDISRNLNDSHTVRFYTDYPRNDTNNIISFEKMNDAFPVKNEVEVTGKRRNPFIDGTAIYARDPTYLAGNSPYAGSIEPQMIIASTTNMNSIGRRRLSKDINSNDISDVAREAASLYNRNSSTVTRVIIKVRGDANITPGQVIYLDSSYKVPVGYWYIVSTQHNWTANGYETEFTASSDKLRFSSELIRLQSAILDAKNAKKASKTIKFSKVGADLYSLELASKPEVFGGQPSLRFPLDLVPELSVIRHVNVKTTRMLAPLLTGINPGLPNFSNTNWYVLPNAQTSDDNDYTMNDTNWIAQRYVMPTISAGRLRFAFVSRIPTSSVPSPGQTIKVGIFGDRGGVPDTTDIQFNLLRFLLFGERESQGQSKPPSQGNYVYIPFTSLTTGGTSDWATYVEFDPVNIVPNQTIWFVIGTSSAGGLNVDVGRSTSLVSPQDWLATSTDGGHTWSQNTSNQLSFTVWAQPSLSSSAATGYPTGNGLSILEPVSNQWQVATSPVGYNQAYSIVDFDTAVVARKINGRVDVGFVTSVGNALTNASRWDYECAVTYDEF